MLVSPKAPVSASEQLDIKTFIGGLIHDWAPHDPIAIYSFSIIIFIIATLWAFYARRKKANPKKMTSSDLLRVGFAAGPIPIYILLPLMPFDPDLATVLLNEPFQLLIAGAIGIVWTQADIRKIVGR